MKYEQFKIANLTKDFAVYVDNSLTNIPKKEIELKHKIKEASYNLVLKVYEANTITNKKSELQEKSIALVKYLDFLINLCYDKQIINSKKYIRFGEKLDKIIRYIVAWSNTTKKTDQGIVN